MKSISRLLFLLICLLLQACMIADKEEIFTELEAIPNPELQGNLYYSYLQHSNRNYFPVQDTLWLEDFVHLKLDSGEMAGINLYVDGREIQRRSFSTWYMDQEDFTEGYHTMTIRQLVHSGTGSLADHVGAEYAVYEKNYVLKVGGIDYTPHLSIALEEGKVVARWNPYTVGNFEKYSLEKFKDNWYYENDKKEFRSFIFSDPEATSFTDTTYVGGEIRYRLRVYNGDAYRETEQIVDFSNKPDINLDKIEDNQYRISWQINQFKDNIGKLDILRNNEIIASGISPQQTSVTFTDELDFSDFSLYSVRYYARVDGQATEGDSISYGEVLGYGKKTLRVNSAIWDPIHKKYYICHIPYQYNQNETTKPTLIELDENLNQTRQFEIQDGLMGNSSQFVMSHDHQLLYLVTDDKVLKLNRNPLTIVETIPTAFNYGLNHYTYKLTNNNLLLSYSENYAGHGTKVLDLNNGNMIWGIPWRNGADIDESGQWLTYDGDIYEYNNGTFQQSLDMDLNNLGSGFNRFIPGSTEILLMNRTKQIEIFDYSNKTIRQSFEWSYPQNPYYGISNHPQYFCFEPEGRYIRAVQGNYTSKWLEQIQIDTGEHIKVQANVDCLYLMVHEACFVYYNSFHTAAHSFAYKNILKP